MQDGLKMTWTSATPVLHSAMSVWEQAPVAQNAWRPNSWRTMLALTSARQTNTATSPRANAGSATRTFASPAVMALTTATVPRARNPRHSWTVSVKTTVDRRCIRKMAAASMTVVFRCTSIQVTSLACLAPTSVSHANSSRGNPCAQFVTLLLCKTRLPGRVWWIALLGNTRCLTSTSHYVPRRIWDCLTVWITWRVCWKCTMRACGGRYAMMDGISLRRTLFVGSCILEKLTPRPP